MSRELPELTLPIICQKNANKTGVYVAITTTLILLPITSKMGLNRNKALLTTMTTASVAAYFAARYSFAHCQKTNAASFNEIND